MSPQLEVTSGCPRAVFEGTGGAVRHGNVGGHLAGGLPRDGSIVVELAVSVSDLSCPCISLRLTFAWTTA